MAKTIALTYGGNVNVEETLDAAAVPSANAAQRKITHNAFNKSATLSGSTTPAVSDTANGTLTLTAGAGTIDLTAVIGTNGESVDASAKKVVAVKFINPATNANSITIVEGGTNGHPTLGASFSVTLAPGQEIQAYLAAAGTAVGASDLSIDVSGTGSQVLQYQFVFGG